MNAVVTTATRSPLVPAIFLACAVSSVSAASLAHSNRGLIVSTSFIVVVASSISAATLARRQGWRNYLFAAYGVVIAGIVLFLQTMGRLSWADPVLLCGALAVLAIGQVGATRPPEKNGPRIMIAHAASLTVLAAVLLAYPIIWFFKFEFDERRWTVDQATVFIVAALVLSIFALVLTIRAQRRTANHRWLSGFAQLALILSAAEIIGAIVAACLLILFTAFVHSAGPVG